MSTVEEHFAKLKAMKPRDGGWLTDAFHSSAAIFLGAHLDELEAAWNREAQVEALRKKAQELLREVAAAETILERPWPHLRRLATEIVEATLSVPAEESGKLSFSAEAKRAALSLCDPDASSTSESSPKPLRPDLAIGALQVAMGTTTDPEVKPWLQTALDFLTGDYEPLDEDTAEARSEQAEGGHASDCAVHNAPAHGASLCDCGAACR